MAPKSQLSGLAIWSGKLFIVIKYFNKNKDKNLWREGTITFFEELTN